MKRTIITALLVATIGGGAAVIGHFVHIKPATHSSTNHRRNH